MNNLCKSGRRLYAIISKELYKSERLNVWYFIETVLKDVDEKKAEDIKLCFIEALNNISKHSTTGDAIIYVESGDNKVSVIIEDSGPGFDTSNIPDIMDNTAMEEHGRGLCIIKTLFGDKSISSREGAMTVITLDVQLEW